jgi:peptidoglycan/LPS O-acetylase OafA/YrhL
MDKHSGVPIIIVAVDDRPWQGRRRQQQRFLALKPSSPANSSLAGSPSPRQIAPPAPTLPRLRFLDGWRGIAIAGVLVDHFVGSDHYNSGRAGVELFFVLSGRLMAQILFVGESGLANFYYRRFTRVWPTLAVLIGALLLGGLLLHKTGVPLPPAVSGLTYTYNYFAFFHDRESRVDHLWSLCIEEHTYLYLGLLALAARRRRELLWPILTLTLLFNALDGVISTYGLNLDYYHTYWRTDVRMSSILLGAAAFLAREEGRIVLSGVWPVVLGLAGVTLNLNAIPDPLKYTVGTVCLALSVANIDHAGRRVTGFLSSRWLVYAGTISYSLYIWQQPFFDLMHRYSEHSWLLCSLAVGCGMVSYYIVESPMRRWLNNHVPSWARQAEPAHSPSNARLTHTHETISNCRSQ